MGLNINAIHKAILLTAFVFFMVSCGPKTIYKESIEVATSGWVKKNPVTFEFDIVDTVSKYDIVLSVQYKDDFRFTNQYVNVMTTFPDKKSSEDVVSLELSKSNGSSNGKCSSNECTVPILFQEDIKFPKSGLYKIAIGQYSRMDTITGIKRMELKISEHPSKS